MQPIHIRFGGYQPPTSVHNRAAMMLGQALVPVYQLVIEAVRLLRERERRVKEHSEEILPALERLDRGKGEPRDAEDIKARGMRRLAEQGRTV